jgi:2-keto-4-pentenoate hydratase
MTPAEGYAAARALHERRVREGWRAVGRKIGFTNRTIWPLYGVYEPIWGIVYDRTLIRTQGARATVALKGLNQPRIEPEICFGLKAAPRSPEPAHLLSCLEWVTHSVEIVHCQQPGWKGVSVANSTAENGLHGRLVLGTPIPIERLPGLAAALPAVEVQLSKGGQVVDRGVGANVLDSPLLALAHLVQVLAKQSEAPPLAAGDLVTTGTLTDAHPVAPGETWSTEIRGLEVRGLEIVFE